jgi:hypothetical protein
MKITRHQFNELIQYITKGVLKEYGELSSSQNSSQDTSNDPGTPDDDTKPKDAMTAGEKSKAERDAKQAHVKQVQQAQRKLDGDKAQQKYFSKQSETNRVSLKNQEKELQKMKGARTTGAISTGSTVG